MVRIFQNLLSAHPSCRHSFQFSAAGYYRLSQDKTLPCLPCNCPGGSLCNQFDGKRRPALTWTQITYAAQWNARFGHAIIEHEVTKFAWVSGGQMQAPAGTCKSDVWR